MAYNPTYRIFSIVAYDDSDTLEFGDILSTIKLNNFKYIYIKHNKDKKRPIITLLFTFHFQKPLIMFQINYKYKIII